MRLSPQRIARVFCLLCLCLSSTALANGMRSHQFISNAAFKSLKDGPIKALLSSKDMEIRLCNGSYFPDSGYAARDGYGEIAHWEPFLEQYIQFIRKHFKPPFDKGKAAEHVAFLLGVASHSMADQGFDTLMMAKSREVDKADMDEFDTANDVFLVKDKRPSNPPEIWAPVDDFVGLFQNLGHKVSKDTINNGMSRARLAQLSVSMLIQGNFERMKEKYPWFAAQYLNPGEPGSLEWLGPVIARYWAVLWKRINGDTKAGADLILTTVPGSGAKDVSVDHLSIGSMITVLFGSSMVKTTLTAENIKVTDSSGQAIDCKISNWGADKWANTLKLRPKASLKHGETYTVTLGTGLTTINNTRLAAPYSFSFTTAPQKNQTPDATTPTDAGVSKDLDKGGSGCNTTSSQALEFWPLLLLLGLFWRLRLFAKGGQKAG